MAKFTIYATKEIHLATEVEAQNYEEALRLYDEELLEEDYEVENCNWRLSAII